MQEICAHATPAFTGTEVDLSRHFPHSQPKARRGDRMRTMRLRIERLRDAAGLYAPAHGEEDSDFQAEIQRLSRVGLHLVGQVLPQPDQPGLHEHPGQCDPRHRR